MREYDVENHRKKIQKTIFMRMFSLIQKCLNCVLDARYSTAVS